MIEKYIDKHPVRSQRFLEILTGVIPWILILFPIVGSFFIPAIVAYVIIAFNIYWLYRSIQLAVNAVSGYLNIRMTEKVNWVEKLGNDPQTTGKWKEIYHVIIIPNSKEKIEKLRQTVEKIADSDFPPSNLVLVLAFEARDETAQEKARILTSEFESKVGRVWSTFHPLSPGEIIGKASNETWAAREAKRRLVDEEGILLDRVVVTTCDADSIFPKNYFSLLTYKFLRAKRPFNLFWQAPMFAYNNIWTVPPPIRIMAITSGVLFMANLGKVSKRFFNCSTYSISLKLLEGVGYWDTDIIPEDWHLFLQSFFALSGDVDIEPLYVPIFTDAPESTTTVKTFVNRYEQCKREAWGATDIPYAIKQFIRHPEIPFVTKVWRVSALMEAHFLWSANWFWVTLGATLPTILNPTFAKTSLGFNLSRVSSLILTFCLVGLVTIIILDIMLKPTRKRRISQFLHPLTYLQWIYLPLASFFFSALPGLESHTRLMLGRYLKYKVTEKV